MGNSGKSRFPKLEYESKMRLLKTHSHTPERLAMKPGKTRRKAIERKPRLYDKANHRPKPPADRQHGSGGRDEERRLT